MKIERYIVEIEMPDGDIVSPGWLEDLVQADLDIEDEGRARVSVRAVTDLALTKDDVWCIFNLVRELQTKYPATEGCLQEVADIFNAQRNGDH